MASSAANSPASPALSGVAQQAFERAGNHAEQDLQAFKQWGALEKEETLQDFLKYLPPQRRRVVKALSSLHFDIGLAVVLLANLAIAIVETDAAADDEPSVPLWIAVANIVLVCVYSLEILLRVYGYRMFYCRSWWNLLDVGVVAIDLSLHLLRSAIGSMPNLSVIRVVRLIRLARAFRVSVLFPELNTMLKGLGGASRTVIWGMVLLMSFVGFFSLVAVPLIHPINKSIDYDGCPRCPRAYESFGMAALTVIQQVLAGDSWGLMTLSVIHEAPWTLLFFLLVLFTINLVVVNLILAVVVDKATNVYEQESRNIIREQARAKQEQMLEAQAELLKLCFQMDNDKSGNLTLPELLTGFDTDEYFANLLTSMNISRDEIAMIFSMFDKDGSGDIDYHEFVNQLHKLKFQEERSLLIWVMHDVRTLLARFAGPAPPPLQSASGTVSAMATKSTASSVFQGEDEEDEEEMVRLAALVVQAQRACDAQGDVIKSISASCKRLQERPADNALPNC